MAEMTLALDTPNILAIPVVVWRRLRKTLGVENEHIEALPCPVLDWAVGRQIHPKIANALKPSLSSTIILVDISLVVDGDPAVVSLDSVLFCGQFLEMFADGLTVEGSLPAQP